MASPLPVRGRADGLGNVLSLCRIAAGLLGILILAGSSSAQDPFAPNVRWTQPYDANAPGLPRSVAFAAGGNAAWAAWSGANPAFSVASAHAQGPNAPLARAALGPGISGSIGVAAGTGPWLVALEQVAAPDALHRRTRVRGSNVDDATSMTGLDPRWTRELPFTANGPARIACDAAGDSAWVAAYDDAAQRVRVERIDAATGVVQFARDIAALGLQEIAVAGDGSRAAISAGLDLHVIDAFGNTLHHAPLSATTTALAIAGDGRTLVHGVPGALRILRDGGAGFATLATWSAQPAELCVRAALDEDGSTLAIGWWRANTGTAWRFEVVDLELGVQIEQRAFVGVAGGLQDLPTSIALTPDGSRAAFACWGTGSSAPEAAIWDRAQDQYVLEADLPGSGFALALDPSGTRALVASKSTHANVLSSTGEVRLFDTGERDLQALEPALAGGTLHLAARSNGATSVLFLVGDPAPMPFRVPGITGQLRLRRVGLGVARFPADANGRADWSASIPLDPALIGTVRYFQAAFRSPGLTRLGSTLLGLRIL